MEMRSNLIPGGEEDDRFGMVEGEGRRAVKVELG